MPYVPTSLTGYTSKTHILFNIFQELTHNSLHFKNSHFIQFTTEQCILRASTKTALKTSFVTSYKITYVSYNGPGNAFI